MKKTKILPIIGLILFLYILSKVNIQKVILGFSNIEPIWFAITLALFGVQHIIKAVRWKLLIDTYGTKYPLKDALKGWMVGYSLSLITPGKVGDFGRAYYLKGKLDTGKSLTTVMADRVMDIFVLFVLATIGISIFVNTYVKDDFLLYGTYLLFGLFVAAVIIFSKKSLATKFIRPFYRFAPKKHAQRLKKVYFDFYSGLEILLKHKKIIVLTGLITAGFWLISILGNYTLAIAMGFNIPYVFLLLVMPIVLIILALPISFSGLGTREAALIFFFSYVGLTAETTLTYSIMILIIDYIFAVFGFGIFWKNPLKMEAAKK